MARIPLRTYDREIENLIDRGQIEEAIAHAKNILKQYPKHIETYRLLGKAFLESQRYSEAADILQRVLSVIPDDFVSQLGMSIIREDEGNMDAAIWHMERAYEVQPFNRAVQDELRRLYGRRDGLEPPRVRLTRGSLVRMYAKGELYPQAIAETRAALAEDPERVDLQVLLARMYYLTGQKVEAAEISSSLIGKMAYCFEANHILMDILPSTSRAENAHIFQRRVYDLDPYAEFVSPNAPTSAQVPDQSVMVEHVEWQSSAQENQAPDWARTIGVKWEENNEEALPDWLNSVGEAPAPPSQIIPAEKKPADEVVPDFMLSAGWSTSNQAIEEAPPVVDYSAAEGEENLVSADIPDWLQSMAPQTPAEDSGEESSTSWLDDILPAAGLTLAGTAGLAAAQAETPQAADAVETDWIADGNQVPAGTPAESNESDLPSWLSELRASDSAANSQPESNQTSATQPVNDLPAWLRGETEPAQIDFSSTQGAADAEPLLWFQEPDQPAEPAASTDMPAWLREEASPQEPEDAVPTWLSANADQINLPSDSVISELPTQDLPAASSSEPNADQDLSAFEIPGWGRENSAEAVDSNPGVIPTPAAGSDELPDWLTALSQADEESMEAKPAASKDEWGELAKDTPSVEAPVSSSQDLPLALAAAPESTPPSTGPALDDMDAALAWLEGLAAKQGADEDSLKISAPEDRTEVPPDWVIGLASPVTKKTQELPPIEPLPVGVETTSAEVDEIPDWLRSIETTSPQAALEPDIPSTEEPAATAIPAAELPDWLMGPAQNDTETTAGAMPAWFTAEPSTPTEPIDEISPAPSAVEPIQAPDPNLNEMDSAMAWLEGLAMNPVAEEQTAAISNPQEPSEVAPDWSAELAAAENVTPAESLSQEKTQPIKIKPDIESEAIRPAEFEPAVIPPDLTTAADAEAVEELPAWLAGLEEEQTSPAAVIEPTPVVAPEPDIIPEKPAAAEPELLEMPSAVVQPAGPDLNDMDAAMAWLEALALKQGADEDSLKITAPEARSDTQPAWIAALADQDRPAEPIEVLPPEPVVAEPIQTLSAERLPLQPASEPPMSPPPVQPVVPAAEPIAVEEPAAEMDIPDWLLNYEEEQQIKTQTWQAPVETADQVSAQSSAVDDSVTLWLQRHHPGPGTAPLAEPAGEEIPAPAPVEAEILPSAPGSEYVEARSALERGSLDEAVERYSRLVKSGQHLAETIGDLNQALDRHPVDVGIWQLLGDTYSKADKIQEALDAYTKAEDLLQ